jgi:hypothetical protein
MTLMVHSSLRQVGGPVTVVRAILETLGREGTLLMPAESPGVSDPSSWSDARVKAEWHETIRANLPVFDPLTTPTTMASSRKRSELSQVRSEVIIRWFRFVPTVDSRTRLRNVTHWHSARAQEPPLRSFTIWMRSRYCSASTLVDARRCTTRSRSSLLDGQP